MASAQLPPKPVVIREAHPNFGFDPNPIQRAYRCHCSREAFEVPSVVAAALAASRVAVGWLGSDGVDRQCLRWICGIQVTGTNNDPVR